MDRNKLYELREKLKKKREEHDLIISVCAGTGCVACGSCNVYEKLKDCKKLS